MPVQSIQFRRPDRRPKNESIFRELESHSVVVRLGDYYLAVRKILRNGASIGSPHQPCFNVVATKSGKRTIGTRRK